MIFMIRMLLKSFERYSSTIDAFQMNFSKLFSCIFVRFESEGSILEYRLLFGNVLYIYTQGN